MCMYIYKKQSLKYCYINRIDVITCLHTYTYIYTHIHVCINIDTMYNIHYLYISIQFQKDNKKCSFFLFFNYVITLPISSSMILAFLYTSSRSHKSQT